MKYDYIVKSSIEVRGLFVQAFEIRFTVELRPVNLAMYSCLVLLKLLEKLCESN